MIQVINVDAEQITSDAILKAQPEDHALTLDFAWELRAWRETIMILDGSDMDEMSIASKEGISLEICCEVGAMTPKPITYGNRHRQPASK